MNLPSISTSTVVGIIFIIDEDNHDMLMKYTCFDKISRSHLVAF